MSIEKAELKKAVAHEIGCRLDDLREGAEREVHAYDGARKAFSQGSKSVTELLKHVEKEMDEGAFNDLDGPLAVAAIIKKYVQRAANLLDNMQMNAEANHLKAQGKVEALAAAVSVPKKLWDEEHHKVEVARTALNGSAGPRSVGTHPGDPLAERRAEAKAQNGTTEAAASTNGVHEAEAKASPPAGRGRGRKAN